MRGFPNPMVSGREQGIGGSVHTRWGRVAVLAALAALPGCAKRQREPMPPLGPTLEIVNTSSLVYRVTVHPGLVVQVHPGQRKCVRAGTFHEARTMQVAALADTRAHRTPPENLMSAPGWVLEIGDLPRYDVLSLRPAKPCDP